jgi:hypothetical protein
MNWKMPPRIKVYEALGSVADGRVTVDGKKGKVVSSKKDKTYTVEFNGKDEIMANDNGSYWQGYLGYPSIAFLMQKGVIGYDKKTADSLTDIAWNDVNKKFKRDYGSTEKYCLDLTEERGMNRGKVMVEVDRIYSEIAKLNLKMLGEKKRPAK